MGSGASAYRNTDRENELFEAIEKQNFKRATMLIETGVFVDCINSAGSTPLIEACQMTNEEASINFVKYLVEKNCNISQQDVFGVTAYFYAVEHQRKQIVILLEQKLIWELLLRGIEKRAISINDYLILYDICESEEYN